MMNKKQMLGTVVVMSMISTSVFASGTAVVPTAAPAPTATGVTASGTTSTGMVAPTALSVEVSKVDFVDSKTLTVGFNGALPGGVSPESDVKLFKDLKITSATKNMDNAKKVVVELENEFAMDGSFYSLLSVSSSDASIDFTATAGTTTYANTDTTSNLVSVAVTAPKTLELTFAKDLTENAFEFKLLQEVKKTNMFFDGANLNFSLEKSLEASTNYFFMFLSLKDDAKNEIEVSNSMYDFLSPATFSDTVVAAETATGAEMTASGVTGSGETASGMTVTEAAAEVTSTPDTGAKTNILIALTFLLSIAYFVARRKANS
jgi:hypothetical protein